MEILTFIFNNILTGTVLAAIIGAIIYRRKNKAETKALEGSNTRQSIENFDFGYEVLNKQAVVLQPVLDENRTVKLKNHQLQTDLEISKYNEAKSKGAEEAALRQVSTLIVEVKRLQDMVEELTKKVADLTKVVERQAQLLRQHNIEFEQAA